MITRVLGIALLVVLGWLAILAGGMFIPGAAPSALVILPRSDLLARLPDAGLVHAARFTATVSGVSAGEIYGSGAGLLVLPAGLPLCMIPDPRP
ncbi:hypothetical protein [Paracoccus tegillarcae]|uniref:hypothetical protein n=1 Tax=Paracoccus tegillarcae TaxID=1529068 RepID=UPI0013004B2F|nr:hypothetical protein [Paracoccus tegillarcae]